MRRDIDIEPLLSPWMERQARSAPDDLLPRVMREVGTMSQESTTIRAWLYPSSTVGWMTGGIAVVAMAIALGVFLANLRGLPAGEPSSPSPEATSSSAARTIVELDPVGDATADAPDIVAVSTTRIPADEVVLKIELAEPMTPGTEVRVYLETNGIGPYGGGGHPIPLDDPEWCNPWFMEAGVRVGSEGFASNTLTDVWHPGRTVADGTTLTLPIPLDTVAPDGFLTLFVRTTGTGEGEPWSDDVGQDRFPDDDNTCYPVMWPED
jgi:hypothetical protein